MKYACITIGLILLGVSCDLEDPTAGIADEDVIRLTVLNDNPELPADGVSRKSLQVSLGDKADAGQTITLITEAGSFTGADASSPQSMMRHIPGKTLEVSIIADTKVRPEVVVTAMLDGYSASQSLSFIRSLPDAWVVEPEKLSIANDRIDFARVQIQLLRDDDAHPSDRHKISFTTSSLDSATLDVVPFTYTNGDLATVQLRSGNGLMGKAKLTITTQGANGILEKELIFDVR